MGKLDMIRASDGAFGLLLESGRQVQCVLLSNDKSVLHDLWNKTVVIEGRAVFRPSGSVRRIEVEAIALAREADRIFSKAPKPRDGSLMPLARRVRRRQTRTTGANAIFGKWPGHETDEEILAALKGLDR